MRKSSFTGLQNRMLNRSFNDFTKSFVFESKIETPDGQGGFVTTWATFATVDKGFVTETSGDRSILDDHIKSKYKFKFGFKFVSGLKEDMRILYNGDYYNIGPIKPLLESDIWIDIFANKSIAT